MVNILVSILGLSLVVYLVSALLPGVKIKSFGTAILVAVVYSLLNFFLRWLVTLFALPFIVLTFGLFIFFINAFFLWLTDKLLDDFEIEGCGTTLFASLLISLFSWILRMVFPIVG